MRSSSINVSLSTSFLFVLLLTQFLITIESRSTGSSDNRHVQNALRNWDKSKEHEGGVIFKDDVNNEEDDDNIDRDDVNIDRDNVKNVKDDINTDGDDVKNDKNEVSTVNTMTVDNRHIIDDFRSPCPEGQDLANNSCRDILRAPNAKAQSS